MDGAVLDRVGGKAADLCELIGAGLPVPPGFCVTTEAYRLAAGTTDLGRVCAALATTSPSDTEALNEHARQAGELLATAPMPHAVAGAVAAAYVALSDGPGIPVAVRSSATAEDLPTASFAGSAGHASGVLFTADPVTGRRHCAVVDASRGLGEAVVTRGGRRAGVRHTCRRRGARCH